MLGFIAAKEGALTRFDIVVNGHYWGEGRYARNGPKGKFPLAVVFTRFPALALVFRVASVLYVIWLAKKLLEPSRIAGEERRPLRFRDGLVLNLINPKAYAAALALLSACAETGTSYATTFAWVFVVSTSVGIVVDLAWLSAGALLARRRGSAGMSPGWNLAFAGLLVVSVVASTFWI